MATVTCHTEGCGNAGIPLEMDLTFEMDGVPVTITDVQCGACGQAITDVVDGQS